MENRSPNSPALDRLSTPVLLLDWPRVQGNVDRMQATCNHHLVELWPHVKTHKMVEVAKMQVEAGASGLTCAKIGEAEALLDSGVKRVFIAYSLVSERDAPRLASLASQLDELVLATTSLAQAKALERLLNAADLTLPAMIALDTGLGREGVRRLEEAVELAAFIGDSPHMVLKGIYTHEGQAYTASSIDDVVVDAHKKLVNVRDQIDSRLALWPGSTLTATKMAALEGITAIRPGNYVFGDLTLAALDNTFDWNDIGLTILTTVVDRPEPGLALLDAGSKTLTSDHVADGRYATDFEQRDIHVRRLSEEHGFATGGDVDILRVGDRIRLVPAHVCPVVNLFDNVIVMDGAFVIDSWRVAARGKVT